MQGFIHYLEEAKNTHLEHLEDEIINNGSRGALNAINFLKSIRQMFRGGSGRTSLTVKWDGAPAIVCGRNPDNGRFFVGTKSVFNKTPKINYTSTDIRKNHSGAVADKLEICLRELPKLGIKGVIQGDLLFTNGDKNYQKIKGKNCITFTPNTITYCVEKGSAIHKDVDNATVGIVFHTKYVGNELGAMQAQFGVNTANFGTHKDVYAATAEFKDATKASMFTSNERQKYDAAVNRTEGSLKQASKFLDTLVGTGTGKFMFNAMFKVYFNRFVRKGMRLENARKIAVGFTAYFNETLDKEIGMKKTEAARKKWEKVKVDGMQFLSTNQQAVYMTVASYMNIIYAKNIVIKQLEKIKGIGTYIKTDTGFKVTAPEGFVAIRAGKAVKLVDRLEFSRANFSVEKNWG